MAFTLVRPARVHDHIRPPAHDMGRNFPNTGRTRPATTTGRTTGRTPTPKRSEYGCTRPTTTGCRTRRTELVPAEVGNLRSAEKLPPAQSATEHPKEHKVK
jgi:hypothetical protein